MTAKKRLAELLLYCEWNKLGGELWENTEEIGVDSRVLFGIIPVWENTATGQIGIAILLQNAISPN